MKNKPLISIVSPVYNVASYLDVFVQSILDQTYQNFELLLVTDCPTDSSLNICKKYSETDSRVKIIEQPFNMGVARARNRGLSLAAGEYVMLADSDDYLAQNALELELKLIQESNVDIVYGGYYTDCDGEISLKKFRFAKEYYSYADALRNHLNFHTLYGYPWGKLFKRSVLEGVQDPEDMSSGDDGVFSYRALCNAKNGVAFTSQPVYYYRIRRDSLTARGSGFRERDLDIIKQIQYVRQATENDELKHYLDVFEFLSYLGMLRKYESSSKEVQNRYAEQCEVLKKILQCLWKRCFAYAKNPKHKLSALQYGLMHH